MHLLLTGATGLVGAAVLDAMLAHEGVSRISILSRKPVKMAEGHDKVKVILHQDFSTYDQQLLEQLKDAHGVVWALGVSQNAVDKEEYFKITHDYAVAAAKAFASTRKENPFVFVYVSGGGATQEPGALTPQFGRVKGQVESALFEFGKSNSNLKVYNVRPAGVDWRAHPEIHPFIPAQALYKRVLLPGISVLRQQMVTPTRPMGKLFTELAMSSGEPLKGNDISMEGRTLSNIAILRMAAERQYE